MGVFANKTELRERIKALWAKARVGLWEQVKRVGEGNKSEDQGARGDTKQAEMGKVLENPDIWRGKGSRKGF